MTYRYKSESALRYREARRRIRRALDTEWQVTRDRILNELDAQIAGEFEAADAEGQLLSVDDATLRRMAREAIGDTRLLPEAS